MKTNNTVIPSITINSEAILIIAIFTVIIITVAGAVSTYKIVNAINDKAPDFSLKTIDGEQISLQSFKGKPAVLWFMSLSCPSCYAQADVFKQIKNEYGTKIDVLVIDMLRDSDADLQDFIAKFGSPDWKVTVDTGQVAIKYGITVTDSTIVVDGDGNIKFKNLGPAGYQQIKDIISNALTIA
ncbi:MAG: TlpA family protein disulfide reductase [Nitrososphaeraceae archaeon]